MRFLAAPVLPAASRYNYLVLDDGWSAPERVDGRLVPDPKRFPSGMKALGEYIHSKGLKFGIYGDAGHMTCAKLPGAAPGVQRGVVWLGGRDGCWPPARPTACMQGGLAGLKGWS